MIALKKLSCHKLINVALFYQIIMKYTLFVIVLLVVTNQAFSQLPEEMKKEINAEIKSNIDKYIELREHLHQNPELSFQEKETSKRMAKEIKALGFEVTENFGGYGVVGVLRNGEGPVVLVRADMDALPVEEKTGLPCASTKKAIEQNGKKVSVMHACGHDIHMTVWTGVANTLTKLIKHWQGTLIMIAQPAEERGGGAKAMIKEGLFKKFPRPDYAIALHVSAELEAGKVGLKAGPTAANVDVVDITVHGEGGHGAYPHKTIDPVVLSARLVLALQTIVSREISPLDPAVVTVGAINGGAKHNVIPDNVKLQLTLRSYSDDVRQQTIDAIKRIAKGIGLSSGIADEKLPEVVVGDEFTPATINNQAMYKKVKHAFEWMLGIDNVTEVKPVMAGEDFGRYGKTPENVPICLFWLGTVSTEKMQASRDKGTKLPPLHSPYFSPEARPTIETGVKAMSSAVIYLFNQK